MKRRGFLKTLAGLCGVAVAPAIQAAPVVRTATPIEKTHILPMPMRRPIETMMELIERGHYNYRMGYCVDWERETVERIG